MDDQEIRAYRCPHCGTVTQSAVRGRAISSGRDPSGTPVDLPTEWALVQCGRCEWPCVQIREDFGRGFQDDSPTVYYPRQRRLSQEVPDQLRIDWDEARTCFDAKAYRATVMMVRRTLEGVATLQGITGKDLARKLEKMVDAGLLEPTLAEWAKALRLLGNEGAHGTQVVNGQDAQDALDFAEALLDHLYVLRRRFEQFQSRRGGEMPPPA